MGALVTKRSRRIADEQDSINRATLSTISSMARELDRVKLIAAWAFDNLLQGKGDIEEADLVIIKTNYEAAAPLIRAFIPLLDDLESIRVTDAEGNLDPIATRTALDSFITKYGINVGTYDTRFDQ
jgi:hypothetical protein